MWHIYYWVEQATLYSCVLYLQCRWLTHLLKWGVSSLKLILFSSFSETKFLLQLRWFCETYQYRGRFNLANTTVARYKTRLREERAWTEGVIGLWCKLSVWSGTELVQWVQRLDTHHVAGGRFPAPKCNVDIFRLSLRIREFAVQNFHRRQAILTVFPCLLWQLVTCLLTWRPMFRARSV